jgi:TRAP-type C4-dicarboxylate transport system permease small subunit
VSHAARDGQIPLKFDPARNPGLARLDSGVKRLHQMVMIVCAMALVLAAMVLTYSVAARYFLKISTEWQDEFAVFLLVGATFLSSAFVQSYRGHVGIEALSSVLPPHVNRWRMLLVDLFSTLFCAFFAYKSWTLLHEAWSDGQTTTSSWGPPLWIPYSTMALGMTLLFLQILMQLCVEVFASKPMQRNDSTAHTDNPQHHKLGIGESL